MSCEIAARGLRDRARGRKARRTDVRLDRRGTLSGIPSASLSSHPDSYTMHSRLLSLGAASRRACAADHSRSPDHPTITHGGRRRFAGPTAIHATSLCTTDRPPSSTATPASRRIAVVQLSSLATLLEGFFVRRFASCLPGVSSVDKWTPRSKINRPLARKPGDVLFSSSASGLIKSINTELTPHAPQTRGPKAALLNASAVGIDRNAGLCRQSCPNDLETLRFLSFRLSALPPSRPVKSI